MRAHRAGWGFAALALALAACRDGGTGASGPLGVGPAQVQLAPCATHPLPLTGARNDAVLWTSSNPEVASVSERGVVRARAPGQATVAARLLADTSHQAAVTVTVTAGSPSLTVAGAAADTIDGRPAQPITAVLRYSAGCPAAGVFVRFSSPRVVLDPFYPTVPAVLLAAAGTTPASDVAEVRTDSLGRAAAALRMGPRPGVFQVYVAPRGGGLVDSVGVTVHAGALRVLRAEPRDTALFAGASYGLRVRAADRYGNPRPDPVSYVPVDGTVSAAAGTIRGEAFGRGSVVVRAGALADTVRVSVVPRGVLAGYRFAATSADSVVLVMVHLDGSGYRRIATPPFPAGYNAHFSLDWHPDGSRVVYAGGDIDRAIFIVDTLGGAPRTFMDPGENRSAEFPRFSADGRFLYFAQRGLWELWRARADGSDAEPLGPFQSGHFATTYEVHPAPSPDGTRVAAAQGDGFSFRIRTFDPAGAPGQVSAAPGASGFGPRWSPAGDWIAYLAPDNQALRHVDRYDWAQGVLRLVRPDGTGDRQLRQGRYSLGFDWSPDGRYLVARSESGLLEVIDVQTGLAVPLPFSGGIAAPSWGP